MLKRLRHLVFVPVFMIATVPLATLPTSSPREVQAQEIDPVEVVQDFFDEVDSGDVDSAVALLADDFIFTQIDEREGSFAAIGVSAFESVLEDVVAEQNSTEVSNLSAADNTVTGVGVFSDEASDAAGVDRYLQPFTITLNDEGLISRADFTYDDDDAQTATYLEYLTSQVDEDGDEEPPGSVTIPMAAQSGTNQTGEAFMFEEDGLTFVGIFVEPGAEGVLQPAHLHLGTCEAPGSIIQPLASVLNGSSFTLLSPYAVPLIADGQVINVHKSAAESNVYTSCGVVLAPPAAAPTPTVAAPAPSPTAGSGVVAPDTGTGGTGPGARSGFGGFAVIAAFFTLLGMAAIGAGILYRRQAATRASRRQEP